MGFGGGGVFRASTEKEQSAWFFAPCLGRQDPADQRTSATWTGHKHVGGPRCAEAPAHSTTQKSKQ